MVLDVYSLMYSLIYMVCKYLLLSTVFHTAGTENNAANRTGKIKAFMQLYDWRVGQALASAQGGMMYRL